MDRVSKGLFLIIGISLCVSGTTWALKKDRKNSTIHVVVIDSGGKQYRKVCSVNGVRGSGESEPHADLVIDTITKNLEGNYCIHLVGMTYYNKDLSYDKFRTALSIVFNMEHPVHLVNMSFTLDSFQQEELFLMQLMASDGTVFVAASGNHGTNLDKKCDVFPVCLKSEFRKNLVVVGATNEKDMRFNHGKVVDLVLDSKITYNGATRIGTSFSAPKVTREILKELLNEQEKCSKNLTCRLRRSLRAGAIIAE